MQDDVYEASFCFGPFYSQSWDCHVICLLRGAAATISVSKSSSTSGPNVQDKGVEKADFAHVGHVQVVCLGVDPAVFSHYLAYPWQRT